MDEVLVGAIAGLVASLFTAYFAGSLLWQWQRERDLAYNALTKTLRASAQLSSLSIRKFYKLINDEDYNNLQGAAHAELQNAGMELRVFVSPEAADAANKLAASRNVNNGSTLTDNENEYVEMLNVLKSELAENMSLKRFLKNKWGI